MKCHSSFESYWPESNAKKAFCALRTSGRFGKNKIGLFALNHTEGDPRNMARKKKVSRKTNPAARHSKKRVSKKKKMIKRNNPRFRK